jgi:hypothetical protein
VTFQRGNESLARSRARPREDERTVEETSDARLRWLEFKPYHHDDTVQRFNGSTVQRFNGSTVRRFDGSTVMALVLLLERLARRRR